MKLRLKEPITSDNDNSYGQYSLGAVTVDNDNKFVKVSAGGGKLTKKFYNIIW